MKHGHGKYIWNDGSMYEGEWYENKINGRGIYIWPDGRKYNGESVSYTHLTLPTKRIV